jgi:hypothetical protein
MGEDDSTAAAATFSAPEYAAGLEDGDCGEEAVDGPVAAEGAGCVGPNMAYSARRVCGPCCVRYVMMRRLGDTKSAVRGGRGLRRERREGRHQESSTTDSLELSGEGVEVVAGVDDGVGERRTLDGQDQQAKLRYGDGASSR